MMRENDTYFQLYRQMRSPYIEYSASGLHGPTHLEGEVRFVQVQDQQVTTVDWDSNLVFTHSP